MLGENIALSEKPEDGPRRTTVLRERYVLEARVEQGRLGTTYRALDRLRGQDGRRYVAVLILPSELARNPAQLAAFERELAAVRELSHPNIVRIFGLERDGETAFLVLEWIDGESLRSVLASLAPEAVCEADALGVVRAVGNALVYAHARGVVHGDIRPENVLVTERGEVRLLFTSACLARSAPFEVGPRDDVRGLAALAYELMSGSPPPIKGLYSRDKSDEPEPIEGLSRKRWKTLKSALSIRDGRVPSIRKLLAGLELPQPRAPRRGSRPDRIRDWRSGRVRRLAVAAVLLAGVGALLVGGARIWNDRELPRLSALSGGVESGADRAADLTRQSLSGAKAGLERAGGVLAGLWNDVERRAGDETPDAGDSDGAAAGAAPVVRDAELIEAEEFNDPSAEPGSSPIAELTEGADVERSGAEGAGVERPDAAGARVERPGAEDAGAEPSGSEDVGVELSSSEGVDSEASSAERVEQAEEQVPAAPAAREAPAEPERANQVARSADTGSAAPTANDSPSAAPLSFSRREYVVSESGGVAAIEVERADPRGAVSFVWWTSAASARSSDDYADLGRQVEQFRDGEAVRMLYVPITSDSIAEDRREYFEVYLGVLSDEGNQNGALESARVTIVDDDR